MNSLNPYYGVGKQDYFKIISILSEYDNVIESCFIFGSRARGDHKKSSDVDFAVILKANMEEELYRVTNAFEESSLVYTFDIINYMNISNDNLKNEIDNEGQLIYSSDSKGDLTMENNKLKMKFADLYKASKKLEDVLQRDYHEDSIVIDATIQRFEFTFELSWKLMKAMLEYDGFDNVSSPRRAIREGFKQGYVHDGSAWIKMLEDRNRTSHTYDEDTAIEIVVEIKDKYMELIKKFVIKAEQELVD